MEHKASISSFGSINHIKNNYEQDIAQHKLGLNSLTKSKQEDKKKIIVVKNVRKVFKNNVVLKDVNFKVHEREIFGIIGLSGAGKTTLLNLLIGYYVPDEGEILVNTSILRGCKKKQENMFVTLQKVYHKIGLSFGFASQIPSFYPDLSVEENLRYFGSIYNVPTKILNNNIVKLLKLFELEDSRKKRAKNLSGGMQKRLDIACALVHNPPVLILDEPTADLDPLLREHIWNLVKTINKYGTTVIVASHFIDDLSILCDRVAMLHKGEVIKEGVPKDIIKEFTLFYEISIRLVSEDYDRLVERIARYDHTIKYNIRNKRLYVYTLKPTNIMRDITKIWNEQDIIEMDVRKPSLKEVFEVITTR